MNRGSSLILPSPFQNSCRLQNVKILFPSFKKNKSWFPLSQKIEFFILVISVFESEYIAPPTSLELLLTIVVLSISRPDDWQDIAPPL